MPDLPTAEELAWSRKYVAQYPDAMASKEVAKLVALIDADAQRWRDLHIWLLRRDGICFGCRANPCRPHCWLAARLALGKGVGGT